MRIASLTLQNFKRFTDLRIADIPETAKLVLLIGSNGSGKSSIFDALNIFSPLNRRGEDKEYDRKVKSDPVNLEARFHDGRLVTFNSTGGFKLPEGREPEFFGRSSLRVVPTIQRTTDPKGQIAKDSDRPKYFTREDRRFFADVAEFTNQIDQALREPTFEGKQADTVAIFRRYVEPFNDSLRRIFGENLATTIQIKNFDNSDSQQPIRLFFSKGGSVVPFDVLSHGEKQIVILLLNFVVRRERYANATYFIDEMDLHLNTALQKNVLREIVEKWIPDGAQLWTATHALGFIEYANESDHAALVDLDDLDFDQPQRVVPTPKDRFEVFEIAVPRDSLSRLFRGRKIIACEGKDDATYNAACEDDAMLFVPAGNAEQVFAMVRSNPAIMGIRDRDYLLESEVIELRRQFPNYRILPYYSIENLLFHPDNIASINRAGYQAEAWKTAILSEKKNRPLRDVKHPRGKIKELRQLETFQRKHAWDQEPTEIYEAYESDDFEAFYRYMPMKTFPRLYLEPFQLSALELARAPWFIRKLKEIVG